MVATWRGIMVEVERVFGLPAELEADFERIKLQTTFDVDEEDLVDGGFARLGEAAPRPNVRELAVELHAKWHSLHIWSNGQTFADLSEGERFRWLKFAAWLRRRGES